MPFTAGKFLSQGPTSLSVFHGLWLGLWNTGFNQIRLPFLEHPVVSSQAVVFGKSLHKHYSERTSTKHYELIIRFFTTSADLFHQLVLKEKQNKLNPVENMIRIARLIT